MSYLFIDTCAGAGVALVNSEKPSDVLVKVNPDGKAQVEALSSLVTDVVQEGGRPQKIVVSRGPAPFTGLRVGLVTARTLGFAWDIPVVGVNELLLQAQAGAAVLSDPDSVTQTEEQAPRWIVSLMDARRHEVYAGLFKLDSTGGRLTQSGTDWVGSASLLEEVAQGWDRDFAGFANAGVFLVGNAATQVTGQTLDVKFADLARAATSLVNGADGDPEAQRELALLSTEPQYLRRPDIQQKP
ncbi:tRNA (adenosine(37)-N6)-threonylcarbamoyltransferase complex dimerization subunit type 1 TsaB [Mobiluncus sp.]|uniref:tRNA (adenosine(37)-N6)-threonylcarbamoyltransferase complex dimerization subunit type 1 TsaB n=1 Tax=Mobiluncus sp. TaxID=47293 RepID=UPI002A91EDB9|nr:tRNA (adenosine(37)-N6)-threonylcarbamoyltransferase complex dimerization subunit type 1 TsaB [Mobiluncus sp.]MDY6076848.1 tRNA (adenosine(37)-N6)-threonylcarbamoyltransferase complex dimerization subunit type 1 TsaB [Mobiluncus sp.]